MNDNQPHNVIQGVQTGVGKVENEWMLSKSFLVFRHFHSNLLIQTSSVFLLPLVFPNHSPL